MTMEDPLREVHAWKVNRAWHMCVHGSVFLTALMFVCVISVIRRLPGVAVDWSRILSAGTTGARRSAVDIKTLTVEVRQHLADTSVVTGAVPYFAP